jgi:hypothetical protein
MAMSFMSGFAGGAASGLAEGEVTSEVNDGRVIKNVTGNVGKYAAFQGLSASAAKMAEYYQEQVKNIVPAVKVDAGKDVYLIILEGVKVYGLQESGKRALHSLD